MDKEEKKFHHEENEQRDLESGDNPAERERMARKRKEKTEESQPRDLESGDNPEEREQTSGK